MSLPKIFICWIIVNCNEKQTQSRLHHTFKTHSKKNLNADALKCDLHHAFWSKIDVFDDVNNAISKFEKLFNAVWDLHASMKITRMFHKAAPWISEKINELSKTMIVTTKNFYEINLIQIG